MTTTKRELPPAGVTEVFPVLPLRDIVVFPHMIVPLFVGREKSIRALEEVMKADKHILLATQMNAADDDPKPEAVFSAGVLASVLQLLKLPDGTVKVLVEGVARAKVGKYVRTDEYYEAEATVTAEDTVDKVEAEALARSVASEFEGYVKLNKKVSPEVVSAVAQIDDPGKLADTVASHLSVKIGDRQAVLEMTSVVKRLEKCLALMESEISVLQVEKRIRTRVKRQMEKTQREYYLNEQMKAIQKELGDEDGKDDLFELEEKIKRTKLSKEARDKATAELKKLRQMSPMSAEATVVRNYLDWLLSIPWGKKSKIKKDLVLAQELLDAEHYGLDKVKERIVEYLAVQSRANKLTGPILCLVGPPGVGKTSLGKSIAKATGREFVRMSLGGVRDEAEIRGHRRTYIGSMPGKLIQSMRKAKTNNPLFLLDEIDKMGMDFRGDPSSALLEVLDPEQNATFNDHYLEVDYDLSNVMFVTTANTLNIPAPLMDRMELIRIAGYTEEEKSVIARKHLIPAATSKHGLGADEWIVEDAALIKVIRRYTREAGVRNLEREISNLARKAVKEILMSKPKKDRIVFTEENIEVYLGVPRYRYGEAELEDQIGVVTGLAWTEVGGELLTIEGVMMPGKGRMTVTGNLRDVMKESISAAASYVRSRAVDFGIEPPVFEKRDIHVHVPEGATPKDGPSAGVAMATAIVSIMTGIPVRRDIAMTGEITLRGRVLPIGGLKEKLLAALRGGLKKVLIPEDNAKDLVDIPDSVKNNLEIVPVSRMEEVLRQALLRMPEPISWEEGAVKADAADREDDGLGVVAH
ncbi:ATP-dependent Lon protease [Rhodoblastus acidophilus]|uniref:Lon protease n=1 Tax=Rhodoblastus acidophilus TaxID=1074 RepID=A0A212QI42_RHOAC|nr:endopeptidase La [Rhodoblastus acidophilus]MCW2316366.1 ATP-dependent Lon protease [Rhodoblastus acidophilus]PPQ39996.1 endopeptidase La [Rhodoblastus acidophilus]RAI23231.1 endopeptidase La [Rhodoblastus acidophilus]SNB59012.1 ATP-dependent Lon protease [Rhodoblastus acidophilus]